MNFMGRKIMIYKSTDREDQARLLKLEMAANAFLGFKFFRSIYKRRPVRSIFWGAAFMWLSMNLNTHMAAFGTIIDSMFLCDDGVTVTIFFVDGSSLDYSVAEIQRLSDGIQNHNHARILEVHRHQTV